MTLVEHHIKYKEIHGEDKTIWLTKSEHAKLHARLRKEGKCKVPVKELHKISMKANKRTIKNKKYDKERKQRIWFIETVDSNVQLLEVIHYNSIIGTVFVSSFFNGNHGKKLKEILI